jgi:hypothetical protein
MTPEEFEMLEALKRRVSFEEEGPPSDSDARFQDSV